MAISKFITCVQCGEKKHIWYRPGDVPMVCGDCKEKEDKEREARHFAELDKLTLEERLRRVEKWIYHFATPKALHDMIF